MRSGEGAVGQFVSYGAVIFVSVTFLILAFAGLSQSASYAGTVALVRSLQSGGDIPADRLQRVVGRLDRIVDDNICRSDVVRAGMYLILKDIDGIAAEADPELRKSKLLFAERYLRHGLSCMPGDGNLWLRLAMIRSFRVPFPQELATLFIQSQAYSPSALNTLIGRLTFWSRLSPEAQVLAREAHSADVRIACSSLGALVRKQIDVACP